MVEPAATGISGNPPPTGSCDRCPTPFKGLDLMKAGHHPRLRGSKRLRDQRLGKLRVCRRCDRLWTENHDTREHYIWHGDMGLRALDLIAEDCTPERLVGWAAREATERGEYWVGLVLEGWLKRRRSWARKVFDAALEALAAPIDEPNDQAARRQVCVVGLAVIAAEKAAGGRCWPPEPAPEAVAEACRSHPPPPSEGLAYFGKTAGKMAQKARLATVPPPALKNPAPLAADDLGPIIRAAVGPRLADETAGWSRGQRLNRAYLLLRQLRDDCGRWKIEGAALAMPVAGWRALDEALDPVAQLARRLAGVLSLADGEPEARRDAIQALQASMRPLLEDGARATATTLETLRSLQRTLQASQVHPDRVALNAIHEIVSTLDRHARSDCTATSGDCAR